MTDQEKLAKLLVDISYDQSLGVYDLLDMRDGAGYIADLLIANGVTVREWIIGFVSGERCTESGGCVAENDYEILNDVTHWMPLPETLKEE